MWPPSSVRAHCPNLYSVVRTIAAEHDCGVPGGAALDDVETLEGLHRLVLRWHILVWVFGNS